MVLSLAFILAFIGASVALVIGILIFSEVTEAMALTLPEIIPTIPTTPEVEGVWFGREHCASGGCSLDGNEGRIDFFGTTNPPFFPDGVLATSTGASSVTKAFFGKVFDKSELDGKEIIFEVSQDSANQSALQLEVYDGELDPTPDGACGIDCFPTDASIVTSGSGGVISLFTWASGNQDPAFIPVTPNLLSFDSPTGKVTLVVKGNDNSGANGMRTSLYSVEIEDHGTYLFRNDVGNPSWNGAIKFLVIRSGLGGSPDGAVLFSSLPPPAIPIINSPDVLNANETFQNTLNIGWTVLGIVPVALFFFLFAIFGGRLDG